MRWLEEKEWDGEIRFRLGEEDGTLFAEWVGLARCTINANGVVFEAEQEADPRILMKLRSTVAALERLQSGKLVVHGSAVTRAKQAVVLTGPKGVGKSTMAAYLCTRRNWALLADDLVALDDQGGAMWAMPTEEHHWLDEDAMRRMALSGADVERKVPIQGRVGEASRLTAIIVLATDTHKLVRLQGHDILPNLAPNVMRIPRPDGGDAVTNLDDVHRIAQTRMFRLGRTAESLDTLANLIESTLE